MSNAYRIGPDVQLPVATAIWVLSAHLYAILVPLLLMLAVHHHWDALQGLVAYPALFYVAAGIMMAGSAFEVSQNALDHWYLTPETGSANGTGFCDFMFFWFIVASQALVAAACAGDQLWVLLVAMLLVLIFPVLYMRQTLQFLPLAILGTLAALVAFVRLGDPIVFLQLILSPLTMFFFGYLLQTGNQVLHGFTTLAASSGVVFLAWGVHGGTTGATQPWMLVAAAVLVTAVVVVLLRPVLAGLPATPRPQALGK